MMGAFKHPKGLYTMVFIEMWERFSFYGMRYCFVLYMIKEMLFSQQKASYIYGLYCSLAYFTPLIGGWLTDNFLGLRKAVSIGSWLRFIGLMLLSTGKDFLFIPSLLFMILATGLMRAGMNPIVGLLYKKDETAQMDAGFRIFYLFCNIGSFLSIIICGFIGSKYGYRYAFMIAGFAMLIGQVGYMSRARQTLGELGLKPIKKSIEKVQKGFTALEKQKLAVMFIIFFVFTDVYDICAEQAGNTITIFADNNINRVIAGFTIPTVWFQAINPLVIWFITPLLGWKWDKLAKRGKEIKYTDKIIMSLFLMSLSYVVLVWAGYFADKGEKISVLWVMISVFIQSVGEIYVYPIFYPLVCRLAPSRMISFMMGVATLQFAVSNFITGMIGGLYVYMNKMTFFSIFMILSLLFALILKSVKKRFDVIIYK